MRRLDEDSDETDQLSSSVCPATMAGRRRTSPDLDPLSLSSLVIEAAMSVKHRDRAAGREGGRASGRSTKSRQDGEREKQMPVGLLLLRLRIST